jgi:hypothetical protein
MAIPPKSKIAQMRAEHRKRQRRLTFLSQLPLVFVILGIATAFARKSVSQDILLALLLTFSILALVSWYAARAARNAPDPYGFKDEGFSGDGVCPDCGERGTLEYSINEKKHLQKRLVGYLIALGVPLFPFLHLLVLFPLTMIFSILGLHERFGGLLTLLSSGSIASWLILYVATPFIVALDSLNMPRTETCRACGRNEPVPFDQTKYGKCFLFRIIERFWARVWKHKRLIIILHFVVFYSACFLIYGFSEKTENLNILIALIIVGVPMFVLGLLWIAFSVNRFYVDFFGLKKIEEEKPDNRTVVQAPDAVVHHP